MNNQLISYLLNNRIRIFTVVGHYGSGKTEFSVSLAFKLAELSSFPWKRIALVDLDIANPYFRSRERKEALKRSGISVYGSCYETEITAELPALSAEIRTPLEDDECFVIVDSGGNDSGARVLKPFLKYFTGPETFIAAVVNANRYETRDIESAWNQISAIENEIGLNIGGLVNNTHLLTETTKDDILKGHNLTDQLCRQHGKVHLCDCYPEPYVSETEFADDSLPIFPVGMFMRETWLDK